MRLDLPSLVVVVLLVAFLALLLSPPNRRRVARNAVAEYQRMVSAARTTPAPVRMAPVCGLCGYRALGGFWSPIPFHHDHVMHTMGCGPALLSQQQVAEPTHERVGEAHIYRRLDHA